MVGKDEFAAYFREFREKCPLYAKRGLDFDGKRIDEMCIEACHALIRAKEADENHSYNIAKIILACGGCRGKECGEAVNLYEMEEKVVGMKNGKENNL
ncbi:MAG: hypothetical protein QXU82_01090 [Candidatus Aenigmatarchaeota archaeon]